MRKIVRKGVIRLSRIEALRIRVATLDMHYKAFILKDLKTRAVLENARVGRKRAMLFWRWAPRKYWGGAILNALGLPFLRYYFRNTSYRSRFCFGKKLDKEMIKNGIKMAPQFLSQSFVNELLEFHKKKAADISHHFEDFSELTILNTKGVTHPQDQDYVNLVNKILQEKEIKKIGENLTGKKIALNPFISILHSKSLPDRANQEDGQNTPHVDVFYPSYKIFAYLNDVNDDNGAFRYLVGSHEFSLRNAINYYKGALHHYFGGGKEALYPTDASAKLYSNNFKWFFACGKSGDAVFFNVQGIHRRGDFKKDIYRERMVLLIDFRQAEVPFHCLAANA